MVLNFFSNQLSIKKKLIYLTMGLCIATIMLMTASLIALNIKEIKGNLVEEVQLVSSVIGKRSRAAIVYLQNNIIDENLKDLQSVDYIETGCVFNVEGELISEYKMLDTDKGCTDKIEKTDEYTYFKKYIEVQSHIKLHDERIGYFYIKGNLTKIDRKIAELIFNAIATMVLTLFIAYFATKKLQRLISGPIEELKKSAIEVASGNYDIKLKKASDDELGVLIGAFHKMVKRVKKRDVDLKLLNNSLEQKVFNRTKDLSFTVDRLENAQKLNKLWIQNIGHELRTPIHIILNFTELGSMYAKKEVPPIDKVKTSYERIDQSANRLIGLIDDLLDFGKLDSGKINFKFEEINIGGLISDITEEVKVLCDKKNISIKLESNEKQEIVHCDKKRISQVLINILSNAIKFTPENGKISIKTSLSEIYVAPKKKERAIEITISDEGVGIPEGELLSIFNTFEQSSETADGSGGTGLGLSISKQIIETHFGKIKAKNNKGKGSSFIFTIPLTYNKTTEEKG